MGLVHGVVTEDSDIFLVGGQSVYKNVRFRFVPIPLFFTDLTDLKIEGFQ